MSGKRARRSRRTGLGFVLTVVAIAVVVGLLGWGVTRLVVVEDVLPAAGTAGAGDSGSDDSATTTESDSGSGSSDGSADAAVERCVSELGEVEKAVAAARPGVASWDAHVQARTDMLAGRITERRMEAVYTRTTRQGHAAVTRFSEALGAVGHPEPCEGLADVEDASSQGVADCVARSEAAALALRTAESTMEEWQSHLHHMAEYADGGMRQGKAMALWVAAWRKAPEGIAAYADRTEELAAAPACAAG